LHNQSEQSVRVSFQISRIYIQGITFEAQGSNSSVTSFLEQVQAVITDMEQSNTVTNQKRFCNAALIENTAGLNSTCETEKNALRDERDDVLRAKSDAEKDRDWWKSQAMRHREARWKSKDSSVKSFLVGFVHGAIRGFLPWILVQTGRWMRRRVEGSSPLFPIIIRD
jgi:hypothetical protein